MIRPFMSALVGLLLTTAPASAWNLRGHMVVAAIAWDQLTPAAKARASELLRLNPNYDTWVSASGVTTANRDRAAFTRAAGWPDDIKREAGYANDGEDPSVPTSLMNMGYNDKYQHRYWHYIDLPFSTDGTPLIQSKAPNAETQITFFRSTLSSPMASDELKSYDLVWLLHLVGDVHQPLHATSRFSAASPEGDRGGNEVLLCRRPCRNELHAFWDGALGTGTSITAAMTAARRIPEADEGAGSNQDVHAWIEESFETAKTSVYRSPVGPGNGPYTLTAKYKTSAKRIASERAALAGARLARLLNENLQ